MIKYLIFISLILSSLSCSNKNDDISIQKEMRNAATDKAISVLIAAPQVLDSSHTIIYPLILEKTRSEGGFSSSYSSEKLSYWNLIFFDTEDNTQHLLVNDKKIVIHAIKGSYNYSSSDNFWADGINIYKNYIFYDVITKDYNQNNLLDDTDPTYLYISDKQGNDFRPVSPDNYNTLSWEVVKGTSKVILQGQKDMNGDKKFDQQDPIIALIVDVSSRQLAHETFNQNYMDSLKAILTKTWQVEKK